MRALWMAPERARRTDFASSGMEVSYAPGLVGTGTSRRIFFVCFVVEDDA